MMLVLRYVLLVLGALLVDWANAQSAVSVTSCTGSGMTISVTVDEATHPAGLSDFYLANCPDTSELTISPPDADSVITIVVPIDSMKNSYCGTYGQSDANSDMFYTATVVVPVFGFLLTQQDLKVDVTCNFATQYVATLAPDIATAIATVTPSITDVGTTDPPLLTAQIVGTDLQLLTSIVVGDPMIVQVLFSDDISGYWESMIAEDLDAYEKEDMTGGSINLVIENCPNTTYKDALGIIYNTPEKTDSIGVQFNAFRFKDTVAAEVYFVIKVTVCAQTAAPGSCVKDCLAARKKRAILGFMDDILMQSHIEKRAIMEEEEREAANSVIHKLIRLSMVVHDPDLDRYLDAEEDVFVPALVEPGTNLMCIPKGTGVAILVSFLVLVVFVATMSLICYCLMRHRRQSKKCSSSFLTHESGVASSSASTKLGTIDPLPPHRWSEDDYILHNTSYRSPLIENDHLSASAIPVTLHANDLKQMPAPPCPSPVSPTTLAREAARRVADHRLPVLMENVDGKEAHC